jgi:hypothetical protein
MFCYCFISSNLKVQSIGSEVKVYDTSVKFTYLLLHLQASLHTFVPRRRLQQNGVEQVDSISNWAEIRQRRLIDQPQLAPSLAASVSKLCIS